MAPRIEARGLTWEESSNDQRRAVELVAARVRDALERLDEIAGSKSRRQCDRAAQVVAIDGDRGSGKTSLLLSLTRNDADFLPGVDASRLVWLAPLDLEPIASPTNLLAAALDRIEATGTREDDCGPSACGRGGSTDASGLRPGGSELERAWELLRRLKGDVALAWDGNLAGRAEGLDPDAYAAEILRAEKIRRTLNCRLETALACLSRHWLPRCSSPPVLFVLPVDDFDLAPEHAMPLLRLLRMVSVPQLFTVLLTDERVLADVAVWDRIGTLAAALNAEHLAGLPANVERLHSRGRQLAQESLRKHLPPTHMTPRLERWSVSEALQLTVPGQDAVLGTVLGGFRMGSVRPRPPRFQSLPSSLAAFLFVETVPRDHGGFTSSVPERAYYAQAILETQPRRLVDLYLQLQEMPAIGTEPSRSEQGTAALSRLLVQECRRALKEQYWVDWEGVQTLLASMHREASGEWRVERDGLNIHGSTRPEIETVGAVASMSLAMRSHVEWRIGPAPTAAQLKREDEERQRSGRSAPFPRQYLPGDAGAWFVLLHDVLESFVGHGRVAGGELRSLVTWEEPLASNTLLLPSTGLIDPATGRRRTPDPSRVEWPMVRWRTFREFDVFLGLWRTFLGALFQESPWPQGRGSDSGVLGGALACGWIACNCRALLETNPDPVPAQSIERLKSAALEGLETTADAWVTAKLRLPEHGQARFWLIESLGMLSPEMGLSPDDAALLLQPHEWPEPLRRVWTDEGRAAVAPNVRAFRTAPLYRILESGAVDLALGLGFETPAGVKGRRPKRIIELDKAARRHPINSFAGGVLRPRWGDLTWDARSAAHERLRASGAAVPGHRVEGAEQDSPEEPGT